MPPKQYLHPWGPPDRVYDSVQLSGAPGFLRRKRARGAKAAGRAYEKKAQLALVEQAQTPHTVYLPSPWFRYVEARQLGRLRYCQPDGLFFDFSGRKRKIIIVEIKLRHTSEAFEQLYNRYLPIVATYFGCDLWHFALCEVVRWFDPATAFPVFPKLRKDIRMAEQGEVAVNICRV
jgi:hypothetical protein